MLVIVLLGLELSFVVEFFLLFIIMGIFLCINGCEELLLWFFIRFFMDFGDIFIIILFFRVVMFFFLVVLDVKILFGGVLGIFEFDLFCDEFIMIFFSILDGKVVLEFIKEIKFFKYLVIDFFCLFLERFFFCFGRLELFWFVLIGVR